MGHNTQQDWTFLIVRYVVEFSDERVCCELDSAIVSVLLCVVPLVYSGILPEDQPAFVSS